MHPHTYTHPHEHPHALTCTHTCTFARICTPSHTYIHTHRTLTCSPPTRIHTLIHMPPHTHPHSGRWPTEVTGTIASPGKQHGCPFLCPPTTASFIALGTSLLRCKEEQNASAEESSRGSTCKAGEEAVSQSRTPGHHMSPGHFQMMTQLSGPARGQT